MWVMYDSTDVGQIPTNAQAVAGYVGGHWPTYPELVKRFPHAQHLSIAVSAQEDADCLDIEKGDATPADAPGWYHRQRARGLTRPAFYGSLSLIPAIMSTLGFAGIPRSAYRILSAHYTGHPHICGPACGLSPPADGTQWTGGNRYDESLLSSAFFNAPPPSPLTPEEQLVIAHIRRLRQEIYNAAEHGQLPNGHPTQRGWRLHHRAERYQLLKHP